MIQYPDINPVALQIGPLKLHWYALMYLFGYFIGGSLLFKRIKKLQLSWTKSQLENLTLYVGIGCILGGRIGYVLFYDLPYYVSDPLNIFKIWQGGMSYHGGLIGVLISIGIYAKLHKRSYFSIADLIAPVIPIGLAAGRIGNFINGRLFGKITDVPWGMVFPDGGPYVRHPSQLYEFLTEGVLLFIILWVYSSKPRKPMKTSALFLIGYSVFRIFCEFFRQPDPQIGYIAFGWLTMGQILCIPMILAGFVLIYLSRNKAPSLCGEKSIKNNI